MARDYVDFWGNLIPPKRVRAEELNKIDLYEMSSPDIFHIRTREQAKMAAIRIKLRRQTERVSRAAGLAKRRQSVLLNQIADLQKQPQDAVNLQRQKMLQARIDELFKIVRQTRKDAEEKSKLLNRKGRILQKNLDLITEVLGRRV